MTYFGAVFIEAAVQFLKLMIKLLVHIFHLRSIDRILATLSVEPSFFSNLFKFLKIMFAHLGTSPEEKMLF